ncbi:MAG TPA: helix-turn-helix transcriptional regulator [Conexibacter sp.]|jgi:transcriptional regulator with XRE-family HTH domain|nr:helix-turn-helix transcriptional regulator [Conexibacter sp.]
MRDQRIGRCSGQCKASQHSKEHRALGHASRVLRAKAGLSQEEAGFRAGLHRNYVGAIERGEINPTFRVLMKLARGLGVPLSQLITDYEEVRYGTKLSQS